jgi:predicted nucleic acid-binding protein
MTAFDTNVLIYACDKGDPVRQQKAIEVLAGAGDGVLLWQVACEFLAASRKLAPQGFSAQDDWNRLAEFIALFPLVLPSQLVFDKARELHLEHGWAYWDAMIAGACFANGVKRLYTEDLPANARHAALEIVNPFA